MDTSFTDEGMDLFLDWSDYSCIGGLFDLVLWTKNAGRFGNGSVTEKLLSIKTIAAIVGLSAGSSWTHSKPMWMHLVTSFLENEFRKVGSINSRGVLSLQCLQACENHQKFLNMNRNYLFYFQRKDDETCIHYKGISVFAYIAQEVLCIVWLIETAVLFAAYDL